MANTKIQRVKVNGNTYDIDLPSDATPSIASLTANTITTTETIQGTTQTVNISPTLGITKVSGSSTYTQQLPAKSGTFAMTSDVTDTKNTVGNSRYYGPLYLVGVQSYTDTSGSSVQSYTTECLSITDTTLTVSNTLKTTNIHPSYTNEGAIGQSDNRFTYGYFNNLNASVSVQSPLYNIGGTSQYMRYNSSTGCVEIVC